MNLLFNPIDQFLVLGSCSYYTNYMVAIFIVISILLISLYIISYHNSIGKLDSLILNLRSIASDAIIVTQGYTSYLTFLFLVILSANMFGMIPYTLTVTSFALTTFCLSLASFIGLNIVALTLHNTKLVDLFLPSGAPLIMSWFLILLEIISYFVRVLSLAIRLFANMMAGHALTKILGSFA